MFNALGLVRPHKECTTTFQETWDTIAPMLKLIPTNLGKKTNEISWTNRRQINLGTVMSPMTKLIDPFYFDKTFVS